MNTVLVLFSGQHREFVDVLQEHSYDAYDFSNEFVPVGDSLIVGRPEREPFEIEGLDVVNKPVPIHIFSADGRT